MGCIPMGIGDILSRFIIVIINIIIDLIVIIICNKCKLLKTKKNINVSCKCCHPQQYLPIDHYSQYTLDRKVYLTLYLLG